MTNFKNFLLFILLVGVDLASKYFFYNLNGASSWGLINRGFNTGIARSFPVDMNIILFISLLVLGFVVYEYFKGKTDKIALVVFTSGLVGNFYDRILLGGVRDFIDLGFFPIFNIADVLISVGIGLVILYFIKDTFKKNIFSGLEPEEIGTIFSNLSSLKSIDLACNNLGNLSNEQLKAIFQNMIKLKTAQLEGNNFSDEQKEVIKQILPKGCKVKW